MARRSVKEVFYVIVANHLFCMKRITSWSIEKEEKIFSLLCKKPKICDLTGLLSTYYFGNI